MSVVSIQSKARLRSLTQVGADGEGIASAETDLGASISRQFRIRAVAVEGFSKGSSCRGRSTHSRTRGAPAGGLRRQRTTTWWARRPSQGTHGVSRVVIWVLLQIPGGGGERSDELSAPRRSYAATPKMEWMN